LNEEIKNKLLQKFSHDELYILQIAVALFKISNPYVKDYRGYNRIDCWLFRHMLVEKHVDDFSIHNLEWMRRKLLHYKNQIERLGFSFEIIRTPISDKAVYGWQGLSDSKFLGMDLLIDKETRFVFKWRDFRDNHVERVKVIMDRAEGLKWLAEQGNFKLSQDSDLKVKIGYYPESSRLFLQQFGMEASTN